MHEHPTAIRVFWVTILAAFLTGLLLTVARTVRADVIRPNISRRLIAVGASDVTYDAQSRLLTVSDDTAAFTYRDSASSAAHLIYNLLGAFGGSYSLNALFTGTGANAPLDGLFQTAGFSRPDLIIEGEIPTLGITRPNGYTGTLLEADVVVGEFFGYGASNTMAEFNLIFEVVGGDMVTAGIYDEGMALGALSSVFTLSPGLPAGSDFASNFTATFQSAQIGIPEPVMLGLAGMGLLGGFAAKRLARRKAR